MFEPRYSLTPRVVTALMAVEASRQIVASLPLTTTMLDSLRRTARLLATHYSTQIEGNQLSPAQVEVVLDQGGAFPGRERDEAEVRHYFAALEHVERLGRGGGHVIEKDVRTIHGLVMTGKARATPYRDGQNVIRDSRSHRIVYMPPEAKDVTGLMRELVAWVNASIGARELPVPVIAACAHHQLATIHPYFDGNGRTARLLTTMILHRSGYALNGIYSLEEYYAGNLDGYYSGLSVGKSHNYYLGRIEADITSFIEYFCAGMADAFAKVRLAAEEASRQSTLDQTPALRDLIPQQRQSLGLFLRLRVITAKDLAAYFSSTPRQAAALCGRWVESGFLVIEDPSTKTRSYRLAAAHESLVAKQAERVTAPTRSETPRRKAR